MTRRRKPAPGSDTPMTDYARRATPACVECAAGTPLDSDGNHREAYGDAGYDRVAPCAARVP